MPFVLRRWRVTKCGALSLSTTSKCRKFLNSGVKSSMFVIIISLNKNSSEEKLSLIIDLIILMA